MTEMPRKWAERLAHHANCSNRRSVAELLLTLGLFSATWLVMMAVCHISPWLALALSPVAALLLVRLFAIQHDCAHYSWLTSRTANEWVGRVLGVLTLTPHDMWKHSHTLHHAGSGNLDRRGFGDIETMTVAEYDAHGFVERLKYRLYRNPVVMFVLGPSYVFLLQHRLPVGYMSRSGGYWTNVMATNAGIAVLFSALIFAFGWKAFVIVHLPVVVVGATIGIWLFYVQHQFDPAFWERAPKWERERAALHGSSFYDLPKPLMWFTGNIGIHHVHHLASRIPFYRLPAVLQEFPLFAKTNRLTVWQSLRCVRFALWDAETATMISFRQHATLKSA